MAKILVSIGEIESDKETGNTYAFPATDIMMSNKTTTVEDAINGKASSSHTHSGTQVTGLTASRALVSNSSGQLAVSSITSTELGYLDGVTSNIQTQLNGKAAASHGIHVTYGSNAPKANGTASAGSVGTVSRSDHVHPLQTTVSGNAGSATKLATARTIDGVSFNGTANITHYGTCSTAAATAAKTVSCSGFTLATGASIKVRFTVTNTAANPTLNVNSTGAKAIMYRNTAIGASNLAANRTYEFVYDGTNYQLIGDINTNTTYSTGTTSSLGLTKLYTGTGTNTDGTMTQDAITDALATKAASSHSHSAATTSASGFMSKTDKTKLDGIASGANKYTLPTASSSTLGGVKTTSTVTSTSGLTACPIISGVPYYKDTNTTYSNMKAATSSAAGSAGLVPAPAAGAQAKYLRGDGTWQTPTNTTYSNMKGATSSAAGKAGLVPAPAAGKQTSFLRGDGTWVVPTDTKYSLSSFGITATAAELNKLDGCTATVTELNYVDGVTSNIQTQLNGKAASSHGTHVTYSTTAPKANGTAAAGSASTVARSDHVHPLQTTVSGNAGSATKLATARNITVGSTAKSFNGTANISFSHNEIGTTKAVTNTAFGSAQTAMTTAQFIELLTDLGAFNQPHWISRGSWSYASNKYISDTGYGNVHLAGAVVEVIGNASNYTIRIDTPTTSSSGGHNLNLEYVYNGSSYSPGWRKIYTDKAKPTASDIGAAASSHNHSASNITSGTLPIARGGTGATSASAARTALGAAASSHTHSASNITSGTLPIARGGTGATSASAARTALGAAASSHTHSGTSITGLTASRALVSNSSGQVSVSAVTSTELGYLDGVTSNIQTQLNGKSVVGKHTRDVAYTIDGSTKQGSQSSEIFNDYTNNKSYGMYSHAEGQRTTAGNNSHAEGQSTKATGNNSHAEGQSTKATGRVSHAEGINTTASGDYSHAEGYATTASKLASHAEGYSTLASSNYQHVQGKWNVEDTAGRYAHIVGWGTSSSARKNIFTITTAGAGKFTSSCTATSHPTSSSRRFKENFREVPEEEINKILSLNATKYDLKEEYGGDKDQIGYIAEDIVDIFPNCVSYDEEGEVAGIDYSKFVPYMVEMIKYLKNKVDELSK